MDRAAGELTALTGLRGLAAWAVVAFHLRGALGLGPAAHGIADQLSIAVDLFFLLSGFVIWHAWSDRLRDGGAWRFLGRRLARLYPLHLAMLAVAVALGATLTLSGRSPPDMPAAALPLHLLLVQGWGVCDTLSWNDPDWSVSCEWAAYLLSPLLALAVDWRRRPTPVLIAAAIAALLALDGTLRGLGAVRLGEDVARLGIVRCLFEFTLGTILSTLWLRWQGRANARLWCVAVAMAVVLLWPWLPEMAAAVALLALLLLAAALGSGGRGDLLSLAPLRRLGELSYATYLAHFLLWQVFKLAIVADAARVPAGLLAGYAGTLLLASGWLHAFVEMPAQRWLNRLIGCIGRDRSSVPFAAD